MSDWLGCHCIINNVFMNFCHFALQYKSDFCHFRLTGLLTKNLEYPDKLGHLATLNDTLPYSSSAATWRHSTPQPQKEDVTQQTMETL